MVVVVVQFYEAHTIEMESIYTKYVKIIMFYKCNIIWHASVMLHWIFHYRVKRFLQ